MKAKKHITIDDYAPPGYANVWSGIRTYCLLLGGGILLSLWTPISILGRRRGLYALDELTGIIYLTSAKMPYFKDMVLFPFLFIAAAIYALSMILVYHSSFRRESRSIDLMRRLPTRGEMFRRVAVLPLLGFLISALLFLLLHGLYYLFYLGITPAGHLPY